MCTWSHVGTSTEGRIERGDENKNMHLFVGVRDGGKGWLKRKTSARQQGGEVRMERQDSEVRMERQGTEVRMERQGFDGQGEEGYAMQVAQQRLGW